MVSPYCPFLFSRKEIIKFSEVALASVPCNFLTGCIVVARRYRSWNTTNTTTDICLLVKNCNKNTETKCKVCSNFFLSAVWTLSHWQGDNFTHLMLITMLFHVQSGGHQEPWNEVGSQSLTKGISGIWAGNLPIPSVTCNPTMSHYVMLIWQQYYSGKKH